MTFEEKIKELNKRIKILEEKDNCEYDFFVNNNYIHIPQQLFMKGIMDDKAQLVERIQDLQKQNAKLEAANKTLTDTVLDLINKKNKEEVEIL